MIQKGRVVWVEGETAQTVEDSGALRIKVELYGEGYRPIWTLPWCYPLLPKMFQSIPKINECVLVLIAQDKDRESNRYYIGPIIDQPQDMMYNPFTLAGKGQPNGLLELDANPNMKASFKGAFPEADDVSIIGRQSEDIILKNGEIDIRCGIRQKSEDKGYVVFNSEDHPSYIQLKWNYNLITDDSNASGNDNDVKSVINLISDKVNLISHKDITKMNGNINVTNNETLIENQSKLQKSLHPSVHGDELVDALSIFRTAFLTHTHQNGLASKPVCMAGSTLNLIGFDFNKFLSKNICIS